MHIRLSVNGEQKKTITKKFNTEKLKEQMDRIEFIKAVDKLNERIKNHTGVDQLWENIENSIKRQLVKHQDTNRKIIEKMVQ